MTCKATLQVTVESPASEVWPGEESAHGWEEAGGNVKMRCVMKKSWSENIQGSSDSGLLELLAPVRLSTIHGLWNASKWMWLHGASCSSGLGEDGEGAEGS